jgi:SSS family solute:Na+ symporter
MLSTSLAVDLYKTFLNPKVSQQKMLWVSRIASVGAGIVGILLAAVLPSIIQAVSIFYGLIAVALFVPVLAGLYSRRVFASAALSSIAAALAATLTTIRLTDGAGVGVLSPQAIGIGTAALVMIAFHAFSSSHAVPKNSSSVEETVL